MAMRIIEARATLVERMAQEARQANRSHSAGVLADRAREYREQVETLRAAIQPRSCKREAHGHLASGRNSDISDAHSGLACSHGSGKDRRALAG